ncbi:MAG: hypothetical protein V4584_06890 [Verrucomicrobiota bacterium]
MKTRAFEPTCLAHSIFLGAISALISGHAARAADLYWDTNGVNANTGTTAAGVWDGAALNWNSDSNGDAGTISATTAADSVVRFSSGINLTGAFTVTASGAQVADSLFFEEGTVTLGGTGTIDIGAGTSGIDVATGRTATIGALIASSNGFAKTGGGNLILGNVNNSGLTNSITVRAGALSAGSSASSSNSTNAQPILLGDTTGTADATFSVNRNQNYNSSIIVNAGSTGVKRISGGPGLTAQQTPTILSQILLDDNLTLGNGAGGIYTGNNYGGVVLGGTITGSAKITVDGFNPFVDAQTYVNNLTNATAAVTVARISGANAGSFTGNVEVARGVLNLSGTGSLGASNTVTVATTGALDVQNNLTIAGLNDVAGIGGTVLAGGNGRTLTLGGAGTYSFAGTVTNPLVASGTTTTGLSLIIGDGASATHQTLSGTNGYSGTTTIANLAKLTLGSATALGSNGIIRTAAAGGTMVAAGGTLDLNGQTGIHEVITLNAGGSGGGALVNGSATAAAIAVGVSSLGNTVPVTGLSALPVITISGGGGSGATAIAMGLGLTAASFTIDPGSTTVYSAAPSVTITGGGGGGATATAVLTAGIVTGVTITNMGNGYTTAPSIAFANGTVAAAGVNPTAVGNAANFTLSGIRLTENGSGYTSAPVVGLSGGTGTITANLSSVTLASDATVGGGGDITIHPAVSGGFALTKVGTNKVTLAGGGNYTGNTTVAAGILSLGTASLDDASTLSITTANGVLDLAHSGTDVVSSMVVNGSPVGSGVYGGSGSGAATIVPYITGTGRIQVVAAGPTYASWASTHAGSQTANLDFDNDGTSNGVEYFMNSASGFTANPGLVGGTVTWINGGNISSAAYGSLFFVQTSSNLVSWTNVPLAGVVNAAGSVSYTPSASGSNFVRLVVAPN